MILLDVSHTCHTASQSGIQQVCRNLFAELSENHPVLPIVYDPYAKRFRELDLNEQSLLKLEKGKLANNGRGSKWSFKQKLRGRFIRFKSNDFFALHGEVDAILAPEILSPKIPIEAYLSLKAKTGGKLLAVFHDAIALRMPKITPKKTVEYFPKYLTNLAKFDAIAAVSQSSKDDLLHFWKELRIEETPSVSSIPLGINLPDLAKPIDVPEPQEEIVDHKVLFVGSVEGRKNHLEALKAAEALWKQNHSFELTLVGGSVQETASGALKLIKELIAAGRPLNWLGPVDDETLAKAYEECTFTLYPSLFEGFGLPPLESISYGKPCVCSDQGGLVDTVQDGGCHVINGTSSHDIAIALRKIFENSELYRDLLSQAKDRPVRTWKQYSENVHQWLVNC
ncbi:glycosyltransferase family 4 protein [Puniceicoccaceae bacterium K14]|nr:glycosyltransferase family 4 protein [Puniceicoccaceae bacterium K14]